MIRLLRPYRGWATKEQHFPCSAELDLASEAEEYLVGQGWAEYVSDVIAYKDMGYRELQSLCKERDLSAAGSTEELIERLENDD